MKKIKKIYLAKLDLKVFTEQDALDYCQLNSINPNNIIELYLNENKLTDISGIRLFKNLKELNLNSNELTDILILKLFKNIESLLIDNNKIKDISVLKDLNNLKGLFIRNNNIKDISVVKNLKNLQYLDIINLELDSNQINYINGLKNFRLLYCPKGFKNISVLNQLNNNIEIFK